MSVHTRPKPAIRFESSLSCGRLSEWMGRRLVGRWFAGPGWASPSPGALTRRVVLNVHLRGGKRRTSAIYIYAFRAHAEIFLVYSAISISVSDDLPSSLVLYPIPHVSQPSYCLPRCAATYLPLSIITSPLRHAGAAPKRESRPYAPLCKIKPSATGKLL